MKHILLMSSWYPSEKKPFLGNFIQKHAALIAVNHKVTVLNLFTDERLATSHLEKNTEGNLTEINVFYPSSKNILLKFVNAKKAFKMGVKDIENVDLIHGHIIFTKGFQFLWAKKHFKKPLIVSEQASYYRKEKSQHWSLLEKWMFKKVISQTDLMTAVSPLLREDIQKLTSVKDFELLPNVVNSDVFYAREKTKNDPPLFLHISTLDNSVKNISGIIEACRKLKHESNYPFVLTIISDESFTEWQKLVNKLQLEDCIFFSGPANSETIANALNEADAFILFSDYETFSIVLAESWATGTPVITTPVGIGKDLPNTLGIQVKVGDAEDLKNAMHSFIARSSEFDVSEMLEKAKSYNQENVLKAIDKIYIRFI